MQYVKSAEDADEIVNDTFLAAWHKKDELTLDDSIKNYLYTIVRNKSLNLLKKKKLEAVLMEADFEMASNETSIIEQLQARETEQLVFEVIEKLPPRCKQIFILSRRESMPNKAIAALMELSEKTVENQITIAIRVIKESLKQRQSQDHGFKIVLVPWLAAWLMTNV